MKICSYYLADKDQNPISRKEIRFVINDEGNPIPVDRKGHRIRLVGSVYGRNGFPDGTAVATSYIAKLLEATATTDSGSVYELGEIHPDYAELLKAEESGQIIIRSWHLRRNSDGSPFMLFGTDNTDSPILGKVIKQNGNYVTLLCIDPKTKSEKEEECFVIWRDFRPEAQFFIQFFGHIDGIRYPNDFEDSFRFRCRPIIPLDSAR